MKKSLVLFLLVIAMTFQFAWGAVAVYCQHGNEQTTQHTGHHSHPDHQTVSSNAGDEVGKSSNPAKAHPDCASCHVSPLVFSELSSIPPALKVGTAPSQLVPTLATSADLSVPERPQWFHADSV